MNELETLLLSFGGKRLQINILVDFTPVENLLLKGRLILRSEKNYIDIAGKKKQCHRNCVKLWSNKVYMPNVRLWRGFALDSYGVWILHTWLGTETTILETTPKIMASMYYGFPLDDDEAELFVQEVKSWDE